MVLVAARQLSIKKQTLKGSNRAVFISLPSSVTAHLSTYSKLSDPLLTVLHVLHACRTPVLDQDLSNETLIGHTQCLRGVESFKKERMVG